MFKPAGFAWLFAHEVRLLWRQSILLRTSRHVLIPVILVGLLFQGAALLIAGLLRAQSLDVATMILIANLNLILIGGLMLSRALSLAIDVLYSRGDADFLLAAPLPPWRILAVRMLGVAASTGAPWLLLAGVMANALAVFGHPRALTGYIAICLAAILAATMAFFLVVLITARLAPATARKLAQSLALLMGVIIFAIGQAPRIVPAGTMRGIWLHFLPNAANITSLAWLPARAALGQPVPLVVAIFMTAGVFLLVLRVRARQYAAGAISAAAYTASDARRGSGSFRDSPLAAAMIKNLRLLVRFPSLVTQTVYRSLALVPAAMILSGHMAIRTSPEIVVPLLVFLTGQLALFFVSIITGGDQAPDLLGSAPVSVRIGRVSAYAAAGYASGIVMALPVLAVALREPHRLAPMIACMLGVGFSNLVFGEKFPIPLFRPDFGKTATGTVFGLIIGVAISSLWGLTAWLLVAPDPLNLVNL
jgi:ABC-2 type transport system permease protein